MSFRYVWIFEATTRKYVDLKIEIFAACKQSPTHPPSPTRCQQIKNSLSAQETSENMRKIRFELWRCVGRFSSYFYFSREELERNVAMSSSKLHYTCKFLLFLPVGIRMNRFHPPTTTFHFVCRFRVSEREGKIQLKIGSIQWREKGKKKTQTRCIVNWIQWTRGSLRKRRKHVFASFNEADCIEWMKKNYERMSFGHEILSRVFLSCVSKTVAYCATPSCNQSKLAWGVSVDSGETDYEISEKIECFFRLWLWNRA